MELYKSSSIYYFYQLLSLIYILIIIYCIIKTILSLLLLLIQNSISKCKIESENVASCIALVTDKATSKWKDPAIIISI